MRIISQKSLKVRYDVPYESCVLKCIGKCIVLTTMRDLLGCGQVMAEYSSNEKANAIINGLSTMYENGELKSVIFPEDSEVTP